MASKSVSVWDGEGRFWGGREGEARGRIRIIIPRIVRDLYKIIHRNILYTVQYFNEGSTFKTMLSWNSNGQKICVLFCVVLWALPNDQKFSSHSVCVIYSSSTEILLTANLICAGRSVIFTSMWLCFVLNSESDWLPRGCLIINQVIHVIIK